MASNVQSSDQLYRPIHLYQTRLLCLEGDNGLSDSEVSCSICTADLLHPDFEGLLVRSIQGATEKLIEYDALSYAWGGGGKVSKIRFNGLQVLVTENLFEALRALRFTGENCRYLWVDALCINQDDSSEKNDQVWNMLAIYQKARKVIAWLGAAEENYMKYVMLATSASSLSLPSDQAFDFWDTVKGVTYLYQRPWFQRLWVQQEIFAARQLEFHYGYHRFKWSQSLSRPKLLLHHLREQDPKESKGQCEKDKNKITYGLNEIAHQENAISGLDDLRMQNLRSFEVFSAKTSDKPEIVDALLYTGSLNATDPRDHIYGIIGMTGFPAKPMRIEDWLTARQSEVFIPIDYSADLTSIMCAVTWTLLMRDDLRVLAEYKVFSADDDGTCAQSIPSWVIDWRLSAQFFNNCPSSLSDSGIGFPKWRHARGWTKYKAQFNKDHQHPKTIIPCSKLILRGTPASKFYVQKDSVWERRSFRPDEIAWRLRIKLYTTDLVVRIHAFNYPPSAGLWLLRPVGNDGFRIISYLPWDHWADVERVSHWRHVAGFPVIKDPKRFVNSTIQDRWAEIHAVQDDDAANACVYTIV